MADSEHPIDIERLRRLAAEKCHGTLTPAALDELEVLLKGSAHARREYWESVMLHANLDWELAGEAACTDELMRGVLDDFSWATEGPRRSHPRRAVTWGLALAASLFVGALVGMWAFSQADDPQRAGQRSRAPGPLAPPPVIGRLTPLAADGRWSVGRPGDPNPELIRRGDTVWLDQGVVRLELTSNTVADLEAPLILQVVSVDRVRVLDGRIRVDVPKGAEGFTVETASAEVIDLGTAFSVNVEGGNTDLVVFDGEVDLKLAGSEAAGRPEGLRKRFRAGEAVHVSGDGTLSRIVNVTSANYAQTERRRPIISAVKDNIVRPDIWDFYEIVPGGMAEDQRAYVDRPHEWNGATPKGMPAYLVGGDYVKTFCNDKVTKDLHIEVLLRRPAVLFVLIDNRAVRPDWLTQSFEPTGDEVGIDETDFDVWKQEPVGEDNLEVGPGNGIERRFSIWRKTVAKAGVVPLGPNGAPIRATETLDLNAQMAMYGVVAVPLGGEN